MAVPVTHRDLIVLGICTGDRFPKGEKLYIPTNINIDNVTWTQIACGGYHTVAISTESEVFSWGSGEEGELGHGDYLKRNTPTKIERLSGEIVVKVACGVFHTAALTARGKVFTW